MYVALSLNAYCVHRLTMNFCSGRVRQDRHRRRRWIRHHLPVSDTIVDLMSTTELNLLPLRRITETLPQEVLTKMGAPAKPDYPVIKAEELTNFDAFLFGIPTRYGNFPAQWKVRTSLCFEFPQKKNGSGVSHHLPTRSIPAFIST